MPLFMFCVKQATKFFRDIFSKKPTLSEGIVLYIANLQWFCHILHIILGNTFLHVLIYPRKALS